MRILITGGLGFIGNHVIQELLKDDHEIICIYRDKKELESFNWKNKVEIINCDIYESVPYINKTLIPEALIHLAWSGLPNYQSKHHIKKNLPGDMNFLLAMLEIGIKHILVTGTCFELGNRNGTLAPNMPTNPENPYAIAKDKLRKWLVSLQKEKKFVLQWVRLFYMYGVGQNPNSILSQLDSAIDNNEPVFNMSGGEQLRDYLKVTEVAKRLVNIVVKNEKQGIIHCCKGEPISIRRLVEEHIKKRNSNIKLNLGYYPYPEHEAMAFWGEKDDQ